MIKKDIMSYIKINYMIIQPGTMQIELIMANKADFEGKVLILILMKIENNNNK